MSQFRTPTLIVKLTGRLIEMTQVDNLSKRASTRFRPWQDHCCCYDYQKWFQVFWSVGRMPVSEDVPVKGRTFLIMGDLSDDMCQTSYCSLTQGDGRLFGR